VISRLLCHTVIRKREVERDFAISFDDYFEEELGRLEEFIADGLVRMSAEEIRVTVLGQIFIRNVAMIFDAYLKGQTVGSRPLFSKTL
jgi:oxygen-independent coproporphyrinogen-3 oxidase